MTIAAVSTAAPAGMLAYPHTPPLDTLPASVYIARLDDLARLTVRLLHTVPVQHLSFKERQRLRRTVSKLLAGLSQPELLIEMDKGGAKG